MILVSLIHN